MPSEKLVGHVAVVTGSDSGIGQECAIALAWAGADVAVTFLHDREGAELTKRSVEQAGRRAVVYQLDQREHAQVEELFASVKSDLGTPTVLVNNAGIDSTGKKVREVPVDAWENEIRTNLFGPFYCAREFLRTLAGDEEARRKPASIINISSVHQSIPRAGASGYDVAKGGLQELTKTLALETAEENVRVNSVAPGMVLTPFNQKAREDPEFREKTVKSIPVKRAAAPGEVASAVVFLASQDASYVHGETLVVDGALRLFMGQGA